MSRVLFVVEVRGQRSSNFLYKLPNRASVQFVLADRRKEHRMYENILKKILTGDVVVFTQEHGIPGVGLDYSWVELTPEEAKFLVSLGAYTALYQRPPE